MYVWPLSFAYSKYILEKIQQRVLSTSFQYLTLHRFQNMIGTMKIPSPKMNPNSTLKKFQSTEQTSLLHASCGCNSCLLSFGFLLKGGPYSPSFPSNDDSSNDWIWVLVGIFPTKWLKERFKQERNDRLAICTGILPTRKLFERSKDSNCFRFPIVDGISPERPLFEKLRT